MRKVLLTAFGISSLLLLAACSQSSSADVLGSSSSSSAEMQSSDAAVVPSDSDQSSSAAAEADAASSDSVRIIEVSVDNWQFTPGTIKIAKGENVVVRLKGVAGIHSFAVKDLGINVSVNPDDVKDVTIPSDTAGTFDFRCAIPCGEGHREMKGTIVIE